MTSARNPKPRPASASGSSHWSSATCRCSTRRSRGARSRSRCSTRAPARRRARRRCCAGTRAGGGTAGGRRITQAARGACRRRGRARRIRRRGGQARGAARDVRAVRGRARRASADAAAAVAGARRRPPQLARDGMAGVMERRRLGRTDMEVSALGFGGAEIGYEGVSQGAVTRMLNGALDAGLNVIDTAECYADSETLIGRAASGRRREFYLFTKVGHAAGWGREDWRGPAIVKSIERSLERLRTDALDLVQLHSCSEGVLRRGDAIAALETARQRGLTRYIGYSGDGPGARHAVQTGRFDTLQTSVSIADQQALDAALPDARERGIGV